MSVDATVPRISFIVSPQQHMHLISPIVTRLQSLEWGGIAAPKPSVRVNVLFGLRRVICLTCGITFFTGWLKVSAHVTSVALLWA